METTILSDFMADSEQHLNFSSRNILSLLDFLFDGTGICIVPVKEVKKRRAEKSFNNPINSGWVVGKGIYLDCYGDTTTVNTYSRVCFFKRYVVFFLC